MKYDLAGSTSTTTLKVPGMVVADIPTDYSRNVEIGEHLIPEAWD
ncbi:MAG: hypothetical protein ABSC65_09715 [Acidobacteriaceae bacterium]|jgi:hypothetical protein